MTDTPAATAAYRDAVERHLAALLDEIRRDIAAGLRAHLADTAADLRPGETLEHRLGSPEQCASQALGYHPSLAPYQDDYDDFAMTTAVPRRAAL
ncbi:HAAS signaling domain-containing protein [Glycomyces niveus]|jgi:uncharacterized membrane-anchored protein YhcB (DUF1043 family)|uniref:Uncharacterized protein n=1 Tax=Glycomyces niveus TaxID=2820287 RepID=A0ABS3U487_9ACTN|nr:hypothetical protein [Glycomyces sp. NEAU-S30]MBO3733587.1 hypothetical protein [Glycomyces sp. NEAU-S30]